MDKRQVITYKLLIKTPMVIPAVTNCNGRLMIPASTLRGAMHFNFNYKESQHRHNENNKEYLENTKNILFGETQFRGNLTFTNAECAYPGNMESRSFVSVDIASGTATEEALYSRSMVPANTEFMGKVLFDDTPNGIQRSIALDVILNIVNVGSLQHYGYGNIAIEIIERSNAIVFISYAWEDDEHVSWVGWLAQRLIESGIDVVLDKRSGAFLDSASQDEINKWMIQAIANSDKIITVLTPRYKEKAEKNIGGVGFEFNNLLTEKDLLSHKLKRYIGVLKSGDKTSSVPVYLTNMSIIDVRTPSDIERSLSKLVKAIAS